MDFIDYEYRAFAFIRDTVSVGVLGIAVLDITAIRGSVAVAVRIAFVRDAVGIAVRRGFVGNVAVIGDAVEVAVRLADIRDVVAVAVGDGVAGIAFAIIIAVGLVRVRGIDAVVCTIRDTIAVRVIGGVTWVEGARRVLATELEWSHDPAADAVRAAVAANGREVAIRSDGDVAIDHVVRAGANQAQAVDGLFPWNDIKGAIIIRIKVDCGFADVTDIRQTTNQNMGNRVIVLEEVLDDLAVDAVAVERLSIEANDGFQMAKRALAGAITDHDPGIAVE